MYVQSIQISPNLLSITSCSPRYVNLVLYATYSFVNCLLKVGVIYGGNVSEKSIFRPLYVEPYRFLVRDETAASAILVRGRTTVSATVSTASSSATGPRPPPSSSAVERRPPSPLPCPRRDGGLRHRALVGGGTTASSITSSSPAGPRPPSSSSAVGRWHPPPNTR